MDIRNKKTTVIEESSLGIYVWEMPNGKWIGDDDGNYLSVTSKKGNRSKIDALAREVRSYGIYEGAPLFLSARRKIDDEEFEEQQQRLRWGLPPDKLDIGIYKDSFLRNGAVE